MIPNKILGTLALIFSLVLLNIGVFFLAIPFLNEGDGAISFPEELAASANTIGIIILAVAGVLLIVAIICLSIYGSQKRRLKKEQEKIEKQKTDELMAEQREFFKGIMDRYGKYFEVAANTVVGLHQSETPSITCKYYLDYDYYKASFPLCIFFEFTFRGRDFSYVSEGTSHVLMKEIMTVLGDLKTDPELTVYIKLNKSYD